MERPGLLTVGSLGWKCSTHVGRASAVPAEREQGDKLESGADRVLEWRLAREETTPEPAPGSSRFR